MAKYNLGEVKLEQIGLRSSPIAVRDMRGSPLGVAGPLQGFVASVVLHCLLCLLIIADQVYFVPSCESLWIHAPPPLPAEWLVV